MFGPPGAGKTILAQSLPGIFPPLSEPETLELTKIYSVAGLLDHFRPFINERPFRNPHHTSSHTAVIGGGAHPRPGEVTLAHRGVLFLDEFPEFDRRVIEALRQPLESRSITVARTQGVHTFPADFTLVAAMNPCPCGNFGNPRKDCTCAPAAVHRYRKKISGPILDRIDIHLEVPAVSYEKIEAPSTESSEKIRNRVIVAREIQRERLAETNIETNAQMGVRELKRFVAVKNSLKPLLKLAYERYRLSVRSYHRILKLARTIADVEESEEIEENHLTESLQYRPKVEL
jgi:magnesium chelatase family protein